MISKEILKRLETIFEETLNKWECRLIEDNGEPDHVHLLFKASPVVQLSKLVNNLKTVSSRLIRKEFRTQITKVYWKPVFWHRSSGIFSTGGVSIEALRKYVEEQGTEDQ